MPAQRPVERRSNQRSIDARHNTYDIQRIHTCLEWTRRILALRPVRSAISRPTMSETRKSLRIGQACDSCHKRGRRCRTDQGQRNTSCLTCREAGLPCTRIRVAAKRGPKPRGAPSLDQSRNAPSRRSDALGEHDVETFLVTSFFHHVYPM